MSSSSSYSVDMPVTPITPSTALVRYNSNSGSGSGSSVSDGTLALSATSSAHSQAMDMIMSAASSMFGTSAGDMLGRDIVKVQQMSLMGLKFVHDRQEKVVAAVVDLKNEMSEQRNELQAARADVEIAKSAAVSAAASAAAAVAAAATTTITNSQHDRLLSLFKSSSYAYPALRLIGEWEPWRSKQSCAALPAGVLPYGRLYCYDEEDADSVVFSVQLFHQVAFTMYPGWKSSTNEQVQSLLQNIDPAATTDRRNDLYDMPLQKRTNSIIIRLRRSAFEAAIEFAASAASAASASSSEFLGVWPPR